jgi:hypothetical protein
LQGSQREWLLPDAESWYLGALGEIGVGRLLAQLGPEWLVLHSVPFGSAETDIDHLVVGPRGIFTLNTKNHHRASIWVVDSHMRVDNFPNRHLQASMGEAGRVAERLKRKTGAAHVVTPVLVMVSPSSINDKRDRLNRRPAVIPDSQLIRWLQQHPTTATADEVQLLKLVAEEPDTWHVDPHAAESLRVMHRFERLHASVAKRSPAPAKVDRPATRQVRRVSAKPRTRAHKKRSVASSLLAGLVRLAVTILAAWIGYQVLMAMLASYLAR